MNVIFVKTAKAVSEGSHLSNDLKRTLSFIDGKSRSGDLAKRAPPSLRKQWIELINQLEEGGFIISTPPVRIDLKRINNPIDSKLDSVPKPGASNSEVVKDYKNMTAAARVVAELEAAVEAAKVSSIIGATNFATTEQKIDLITRRILEDTRVVTEAGTSDTTAKVKSVLDVKTDTDTKQNTEKSARAAELKAFFAAAKDKTKEEAKLMAQKDTGFRDVQESATIPAKIKSVTDSTVKAQSKQRAQRVASDLNDLEAAILTAKVNSEVKVMSKVGQDATVKINTDDSRRLRDLEIENETLKKLLVDAYLELNTLKSTKAK